MNADLIKEFKISFETKTDRYRVTIHDLTTDHKMILQSPEMVEPLNDQERRFCLDVFFSSLKHILRKRTFPKDTLIYDEEKTDLVTKWVNPRYPDGQ